MQSRPRCEPMSLAEHGCCEILLCPQCNAVHLHIGPVSFKLPPEALRQVSAAMAEAVEALRQYETTPPGPELGVQVAGQAKH
jgi:hypothetical protein